MTDVLYVLADKENRGSERELRLSLRSLQKNCKDLDRVFIVTDKLPDWIQNVEHIKCNDYYSGCPEKNVFYKLIVASKTDITYRFLFMNDDFFMMKPFKAESYPYYYRDELVFMENPSRWQNVFNKTLLWLKGCGLYTVLDFSVHCPFLYDKHIIDVIEANFIESIFEKSGYSPRNLAGNFMEYVKKEKGIDCKLWRGEKLEITNTGCVSTADGADDVLDQIEKIFNKKSKFEK